MCTYIDVYNSTYTRRPISPHPSHGSRRTVRAAPRGFRGPGRRRRNCSSRAQPRRSFDDRWEAKNQTQRKRKRNESRMVTSNEIVTQTLCNETKAKREANIFPSETERNETYMNRTSPLPPPGGGARAAGTWAGAGARLGAAASAEVRGGKVSVRPVRGVKERFQSAPRAKTARARQAGGRHPLARMPTTPSVLKLRRSPRPTGAR